jgi:3-phytase
MRFFFVAWTCFIISCSPKENAVTSNADSTGVVKPVIVTDQVMYDTDDPAIWIHPTDPAQSLILGTDKGGDLGDGALYVFNLRGQEQREKTVRNIRRPNNVDVAYKFTLNGVNVDIAVCTERNTNSIRVFSLPDMKAIDNGGISVFENDSLRLPMGIALYTNYSDGKIYAIVGRKSGPTDGSYLWQYLLRDTLGYVSAKLVRKFGNYSGKNEIESIAVDNELGYVYYSDEGVGVRKYYAHPDSSSTELALFGTTGFADNQEGISIYKFDDGTGYILISDQQANRFNIFPREGTNNGIHDHPILTSIYCSTIDSDGNDVTHLALPGFPHGLFVAMSGNKTFQLYKWEDLANDQLKLNSIGN